MTLVWILGASLAGGLLALLLAATVLALRTSWLERALPRLVSFSTGTLLGAALLGMIPHASRALPPRTVAHEVPQELGEFMVYLRSGLSRRRALLYNAATSLTSVVGGLLGYFVLSELRAASPYLLAFAAAGFLYVALADLVPAQRGKTSLGAALLDLVLVLGGIGLTALLTRGHA
jgi:zinc and cadmium transporter